MITPRIADATRGVAAPGFNDPPILGQAPSARFRHRALAVIELIGRRFKLGPPD
jgi:hypothetical protein